jgi:hypothetical protein
LSPKGRPPAFFGQLRAGEAMLLRRAQRTTGQGLNMMNIVANWRGGDLACFKGVGELGTVGVAAVIGGLRDGCEYLI